MRIAVIHNLPTGGALRQTYALLSRLSMAHEVEIFTLSSAQDGPMAAPGPLTATASGPASPCSLHSVTEIRRTVIPYAPTRRLGRPWGMLNPLIGLTDLSRLDRVYRAMSARVDSGRFDAALVLPCQFTQAPLALLHLSTPTVYVCLEPPRRLYEPELILGRSLTRPVRTWRDWRNWLLDRLLTMRLKAVDRMAVARATELVTQSFFVRESIARIYRRWARVVHWCAVDLDVFRPADGGSAREGACSIAADEVAQPTGEREFFLSVGALAWVKGHEFVLDALGMLPSAERLPLVVVHDRAHDGERQRLEERARAAGVSLTMRRALDDATLVDLYRGAALTLCAPVLEPFGLVPLESMACGTAVVGVAEGGIRESVKSGVTGLLTDRDPKCFSVAVSSLMRAPEWRRRLGEAGVAEVRARWTWPETVAHLEEALARASGRGSSVRDGCAAARPAADAR